MARNCLVAFFSLGFLTGYSGAQVEISPGVARVSLIQGEVSVQRGDTGDWAAAALNQPIVGGDRISTGNNSKTELQLDHANILRLGNNAQARIATVEQVQKRRTDIQIQIGKGLCYYTVFKESNAEVEIDTPNAAIRPISKDGFYRIEVTGFETQVVVRAGAVDIATPQGNARVEIGQSATVRGTTREAGNVLGGAPVIDDWDSWNVERDGAIRGAQSWNYTNRYYVGSEDLDAFGQWINVPDYGRVWSPKVGKNWSPYRAGRWVWEPYWGFTWVSQEPWGWAPYHYGRWFLYAKSWMWWPGPLDGGGEYRPEWAPAYVSFFGFGGRLGTSVGFKSLGWLPLGPGDSYFPWYGRSEPPAQQSSVTEAISVTKLIPVVGPLRDDNELSNVSLAAVDERVREALSALPADRFGTGRSAPKTVSKRTFRDARAITGKLPIVPTREMLTATNRPASASSMLNSGWQERYFTKRQPAAAPQSFDKEAALLQQIIGGTGRVVPVREVVQLDSVDTGQTAQENRIKGVVEPAKDPPSRHRLRSQPIASPRAVPSPKMARSTRKMTASAPVTHAVDGRTAPRREEKSHIAKSPRVLAEPSTHHTAVLAAESRGAAAQAAKSYVESANRQLDKGNYSAAIANYKRALQADRNSSAAKVHMERARRAMQAENDILASRR